MYLGEYFQGEWVSVPLVTANTSDVEADADAAPTVSIYKASDTPITGADDETMAPFAQGERVGFFNRDFQLDSNFTAGRYIVLVEYTITSDKADLHFFEVVAGGDDKGAYVAMFYYRRPHANYIVGQRDDGELEFRRGPKI